MAGQFGEPESVAMDDDVLRAEQRARGLHSEALAQAERVTARLRAVNEDDISRAVSGRIEELRQAPDGRWDGPGSGLPSLDRATTQRTAEPADRDDRPGEVRRRPD